MHRMRALSPQVGTLENLATVTPSIRKFSTNIDFLLLQHKTKVSFSGCLYVRHSYAIGSKAYAWGSVKYTRLATRC